MSNGQAAAVTYAREGARVAAVDIDLQAAEGTVQAIQDEAARPSQSPRT